MVIHILFFFFIFCRRIINLNITAFQQCIFSILTYLKIDDEEKNNIEKKIGTIRNIPPNNNLIFIPFYLFKNDDVYYTADSQESNHHDGHFMKLIILSN
jgi:hypothetical protein